MDIERIIMCVMAFGAVLGGLDRIGGNRFGFGDKFEKGFQMLGNVGLSMAGIICLAPALGELVGLLVGPMCEALGMDPAVFGSLLAIDMGGYSLAVGLAKDPELGLYAGVIVASMFGATLVFHIPVGVGFLGEKDESFMKGILLGLTEAGSDFCLLPLGPTSWAVPSQGRLPRDKRKMGIPDRPDSVWCSV